MYCPSIQEADRAGRSAHIDASIRAVQPRGTDFLEEAQLPEFPGHFRRKLVVADGPEAIGRRCFRLEVAPSLERAERLRLGRDDLPVELDRAARPPFRVDVGMEA